MRITFLILLSMFISNTVLADTPAVIIPKIALTDANGAEVRLDTRKGVTHIINFWATWCAPCIHELPTLAKLARHYEDNDQVQLVLVNEDLNFQKALEFLKDFDFPDKTLRLFDSKGKFLQAMGGKGLPVTIITDSNNAVLNHTVGPRDWNTTEIHALIEGSRP